MDWAPELSKRSGGFPPMKRGCRSGWMFTVEETFTSASGYISLYFSPASFAYWSP